MIEFSNPSYKSAKILHLRIKNKNVQSTKGRWNSISLMFGDVGGYGLEESMMASITVDVTGFYFAETVPGDSSDTVQTIMEKVQTKTTKASSPVARFFWTPSNKDTKFVRKIRIEHLVTPTSRQIDPKTGLVRGPRGLTPGTYEFDDEIPGTNPALTWQYYVFQKDGDEWKLATGKQGDGLRAIVGSGDERFREYDFSIESRIVWRLVGICLRPTNDDGMIGAKMLAYD